MARRDLKHREGEEVAQLRERIATLEKELANEREANAVMFALAKLESSASKRRLDAVEKIVADWHEGDSYLVARERAQKMYGERLKVAPTERAGVYAKEVAKEIDAAPHEFGLQSSVGTDTITDWLLAVAPPEVRRRGRPPKNSTK